jgi:serine/threonine-protein kinase
MLDDRYRLIAPLAEGGMSVVWHGHDEVLARSVAVKVIKTEAGPSAKFAQRVRREATALARLSHRHIANVYDYGESDLGGIRAPYLVMELVEGESLGALLRRGPITWLAAVGITAQVADALAAAHSSGVVHCDVTPGNVMLCRDGVKIIDFGIASTAGDLAEGVVFGTPAYLAPERRNGGRAIPASDVYGIGLLLYEMLAGRLPWPDGTAAEVVAAHRTIPPAPLPDVPGLPEPIAALCIACLDVDPARRPLSRELSGCLNAVARLADPHSRRIHSEVTARIGPAAPARSPVGAGAPVRSGVPVGSGAPVDFHPVVLGRDPTASRSVGSPRAGRSRSGTRIIPHGVTALPDPGQPTQPIDEPVEEPESSWRSRARQPFFALPSLLLLVLIVCFGLNEAAASRSAAAGAAPAVQPNLIRAPSDTPTVGAAAAPEVAALGCHVDYQILNQWIAGFSAQMTITNIGQAEISGWTLHFRLAGAQRLGGGWNGEWEQHGSDVTVRDAGFNDAVPPGGTVTLGFIGVLKSGVAHDPPSFTLNGTSCNG